MLGRKVARMLVVLSLSLVGLDSVGAKDFPAQTIRLLVGFAAGGGTDTIARLYARGLQEELHTTVIVENRPGASSLVAIRMLMASPPDGYTLMLASGSALAQGPGVRKDLPYDPLKDFSLISMVATAPGVFVVSPTTDIHSIDDLIGYAKAHPGQLNFGSAGVGAASHLQVEYLKSVAGISMTHIPYRSDQELTQEIAMGDIQVGLSVPQFVIPLLKAGNLRAIAVTGNHRLSALPEVPSLAESHNASLHGIENYTFYGVIGPKGVPPSVIERISAAVNKVSSSPEVASRMRNSLFCEPVSGDAAYFFDYMSKEVPKWRRLGQSVTVGEGG